MGNLKPLALAGLIVIGGMGLAWSAPSKAAVSASPAMKAQCTAKAECWEFLGVPVLCHVVVKCGVTTD